jgi:CPA2 family monovalent cation:H+ antiporter-2
MHSRFGDGTQDEMLEAANVATAKGLVVAVSDHRSARLVVSQARRISLDIPIVARARYHLFRDELETAGASVVVDEETSVGAHLAEEMKVQFGAHWDEQGVGLSEP